MASLRRLRRNQCGKKIAHGSEDSARTHIQNLNRNQMHGYQPYRCPHCHSWHVGSKTKKAW